jgi:hypothetical protein
MVYHHLLKLVPTRSLRRSFSDNANSTKTIGWIGTGVGCFAIMYHSHKPRLWDDGCVSTCMKLSNVILM